ncbi:MAG: GvpL/GvpF family gas vesicle protein [Nocardioidaceae bacterium]
MSPDPVEGRVIHVYGTLDPQAPVPAWPAGIADTPVSTVTEEGTVAITGELPRDEFDPAEWERHADDAAWLGAVAMGHHRVLQAAVAVGDVVPFRLPSLYGDLEALRRVLRGHAREITEAMDRIRGRIEWAVKLYRVSEPVAAEPASTGADYLRARSRQARVKTEAEAQQGQRVRTAYDQLRQASDAAVLNTPQDSLLTERREPMLLNAAFLVSRGEQDRFGEQIGEVAQDVEAEGLLLEASGPWPAYNFTATVDAGSERA